MDFFEFGSNELAKTKRILVYPNITYSKDLEQDSYVQVMKNSLLGQALAKPIRTPYQIILKSILTLLKNVLV